MDVDDQGAEVEVEESEEDELGHQFPEDHHDGRALLQIFPVEMWEQIFEQFDDSKDLQIFSKTFPFWEDILHRTKQAWLFDKVFLHVWMYLSRKEILCSRAVCRRWNTSVDRFLENNEFHRPAQEDSASHLRLRPLVCGLWDLGLHYNAYSPTRMRRLCHVAPGHSRNPIVGRSVSLDWEHDPALTLRFLTAFGKHIRYLRVLCPREEVQPIPFLLRVLDYIPHLPHLHKLELFLWEGQSPQGGNVITTSAHELTSYLAHNPIPHFPLFETLELDITGHLHGKVKEILINNFSPQIRRLRVNRFALSSHLPNLTDLQITVDSNHQLECLLRLDSPLTRLALSIADHANYPLAFKAIQHFAPTVRILTVEFPTATSFSPMDWKQLKSPVFNLPLLKTVTLKGCIPPSLNFICGLESLEYLHIYDLRSSELVAVLDNQTVFEEETVQILRYLNQPSQFQKSGCMYQSDLWEVFGRLREFTFTSFMRRTPDVERCYRRDHYERIKRMEEEANQFLEAQSEQ